MIINRAEWTPIKGYGGKYLIHPELGVVKNRGLYGQTTKYIPKKYRGYKKELLETPQRHFLVLEDEVDLVTISSRQRVWLRDYSGYDRFAHITKLMAQYFVPNEVGGVSVLHLDGDTTNYKPSNLIWVVTKRFSKKDAYDIYKEYQAGTSIHDLACKYQCNYGSIKRHIN